MRMRLAIVALWLLPSCAAAAEPEVLLLWPQGAPGAKGDRPEDKPQITVWRPEADKSSGAAIVVCPGGGYGALAMDHEGTQIAEWLNSIGITAAILEYRHRNKGYGHPAPMQERELKRLKVPVQVHHGTADEAVSHARSQELEKMLRAQGTPVDVHLYENLDHGFLAYTRPYYAPDAAKLAWERTVAFLNEHLQP